MAKQFTKEQLIEIHFKGCMDNEKWRMAKQLLEAMDSLDAAISEIKQLRTDLQAEKAIGVDSNLCQDRDKYYVYNTKDARSGFAGGSIVWWREGGHGYSRDLKGAGIFTIGDYIKRYPDPSCCIYVPCNIAVDAAFKSETLVWEKHLLPNILQKQIEEVAVKTKKELK